MKVGDKLYELRLKRKMSQEQLGEKIGVTRQTISLWEANRRQINAEKLKLICEVLEVSSEYFLVDNDIDLDTCSTNDELNVVCTEQDECENNYIEIDSQQKNRKLAPKSIMLIIVIVLSAVVGIIAVIIGKMLTSPKQGFETASERIYSFNLETLGWIIFSVTAVIALSVIIILVKINCKSRKKNK